MKDKDGFKLPPPIYYSSSKDSGFTPSVIPLYNFFRVIDELEEYHFDYVVKEIIKKFPKNKENLYVLVFGSSSPGDPALFYKGLSGLLKKWVSFDENLILIFSWRYINSTTHKQLIEMIKTLVEFFSDRLFVIWSTEDEEVYEKGEDILDFIKEKKFPIGDFYLLKVKMK